MHPGKNFTVLLHLRRAEELCPQGEIVNVLFGWTASNQTFPEPGTDAFAYVVAHLHA
jgi:hypothetical protein